jgi:hypothetical protein
MARGDIVVTLDSDMEAEPGFVEAHLRTHRAAGGTIAAIGNVSFATPCIAGSNFGRYMQERYLGYRSRADRRHLNYSNLPAKYFAGGISSVRVNILRQLGGFDEGISSWGGEDEDMGRRLVALGVRIVFVEDARVVHWDRVELQRYRAKCHSTGAGAYRKMSAECPTHFDGTPFRFVLPIDRSRDGLLQALQKIVVRAVLIRPVLSACLSWARATDRSPRLYVPAVFRLLMAGWVMEGLRSGVDPRGLVTYGDAGRH